MQSKKQKIKSKLAAKSAKLKSKLGSAVKKAAPVVALLALVALCGCQSTPSRAQTQNFEDCVFLVQLAPAASSNAADSASGPLPAVGDLFTQNQVVENSGSESLAPTHTISTPTQLSYGVGTGGGSTWTELFTGLKSLFTASSAAASTAAPAAAAPAACADGSCSDTQ